MSSNFLKDLLVPPSLNRKQFKCLSRIDEKDNEGNTKSHVYILKSLLSPDYPPGRLYELYFHSPYRKTLNSNSVDFKTKQQKVSIFYSTFIEYLFLHSQMSDQIFGSVESFIEEIADKQWKDPHLRTVTSNIAELLFKKYQEKLTKMGKPKTYSEIRVIQREIHSLFSNLFKEVRQKHQVILRTQHLPEYIETKDEVVWYIKKSYEKLQNIHSIFMSKKKQLIRTMIQELNPYIPIKEIVLNPNKGTIQHQLMMPPESKEKEPVLTSLYNYVSLKDRYKHENSSIKRLQYTSEELVKHVLSQCKHFHKITNKVFPTITLGDMYFDQKSLKVVFKNSSLIYDGLGILKSQHGSIQLQLCTNPTPKFIEFEKSHIEFQEIQKWALIRKYYVQKKNDCIQEDEDDIEAQMKFQGSPARQKEIAEKTHVWRLISIFYYILKGGRHMIQDVYNRFQSSKFPNETPPFVYSRYRDHLRTLYQDVCQNKFFIPQLLGLPNPQPERSDKKFNFTLKDLSQVLNIKEQQQKDSLLQSLRYDKIKDQLFIRFSLSKQIFSLVTSDRYFKRFLNSKKYILMIMIASMNYFYQIYLILKSSKTIDHGPLVKNIYSEQYRKMSFSKQYEKIREYIDTSYNKIKGYFNRTSEDENRRYLSVNIKLKEVIDIIKDNFYKIMEREKIIMTILFDEKDQNKEKMNDYKTKKQETIKDSCKYFNDISKKLKFIVDEEFRRVDRIEEFHKIQQNTPLNKKILFYLNKKLYLLLMAYMTLSDGNWRKYEISVLGILVDSRFLGLGIMGKKLEEAKEEQIDGAIKNLEEVSEIVNEQKNFMIDEIKGK